MTHNPYHTVPNHLEILKHIGSKIDFRKSPWVSLQCDFASGFASQILPLTWGIGPRWLQNFPLNFFMREAQEKIKPKILHLFALARVVGHLTIVSWYTLSPQL